MGKMFYHYQDTEAMTRSVLAWAADPASENCQSIDFSANCGLSVEATSALVHSPAARTIARLEFTEIYFSAEQLAELLGMPALVELRIYGGMSSDWNGPEYIWPTFDSAHLDVLATSLHAKRLRLLDLYRQNLSEITGERLRHAIPDLETLTIEGVHY
jgi:hypothetical protein